MVVDADDFKADPASVFVNRANTVAQQLARVVAGDDDGEVQREVQRDVQRFFHGFLPCCPRPEVATLRW